MIGVSCAFHLAPAGVDGVLLAEQPTLGSRSTSKAAGGHPGILLNRLQHRDGPPRPGRLAEFSKRFDQ